MKTMEIIARAHDGNGHWTETDVTEAVQVIYDAMHGYMGMASGSLDAEEWDAVLHLAEAAAFPDYADLKQRREMEEKAEEERRRRHEDYMRQREAERQTAYARLREQVRIVDEMRAAEPNLAAYPFGSLWKLHLMRQQGTA